MTEKYVHITAGRGPAECAWVVAQLAQYLKTELTMKGMKVTILEEHSGAEVGTLSSVLIKVQGKGMENVLSSWEGTVLWMGRSPFRKHHKRKIWYVGVSFLDPETLLDFDEKEVKYKDFRASGPGGQHRNKVETAIRATHVPSGQSATAGESKSQFQNKKLALEKLRRQWGESALQRLRDQRETYWKEHLALERGNPVQTFQGKGFTPIQGA